MKKVLAVILSVILLASVFVPASSVLATSPADTIDRVEIENVSVIEETYGQKYTDAAGGEYWFYQLVYPKNYTVYFKDSTSKTSSYGKGLEVAGTLYDINCDWYNWSRSQETEHFVKGNTYKAKCSFAGIECSYNVTVTESPVDYIEVEDICIIENTNGRKSVDDNGNEYWQYYSYAPN
ncbi:MAG: hypothetical protein IKN39_02155, partial [Clostridia bacterium]|nr:hypothetical protein [Clostridia bacterium]